MLENRPAPEALREALNAHRVRLEAQGSSADLATATALHVRLMTVLERWASLGPDEQEDLADVVAYVARVDDERHDTDSPDGLDDDAERVAQLLERLQPGPTPQA